MFINLKIILFICHIFCYINCHRQDAPLLFSASVQLADSAAAPALTEVPGVKVNINIGKEKQDTIARRSLRIQDPYPRKIKDILRIRGGNTTDTLNYPYIAAVLINRRLWCAGVIVDENWVVTAAHCLNYVLHVSPMKSLRKFVKVRVGSSIATEGGQLVDVVGAVRHPKFEEEPVPHADIALLKLAENLRKYVNLIKIYEGMKEPFAQSFITITGWGAKRGSDTAFKDTTSELQSTRLKVRTRHYCMDAYQEVNGFQFTDDFFCASLRNGTRDACLFDAGAPAVQQNTLMGIMSFGPEKCGHEYQPAVFIKAFYFRDFVKHTIRSYKTSADLIEAMQEMDPGLKPVVHHVTPGDEEHGNLLVGDEEKSREEPAREDDLE